MHLQRQYNELVAGDPAMKQRFAADEEMPTALCAAAADAVVPTSDEQQEAACRVVKYLSQLQQCVGAADFCGAMVATAPGEKLLIGHRPVRNWTLRVLVQKITFVLRKIAKNCCHESCTF